MDLEERGGLVEGLLVTCTSCLEQGLHIHFCLMKRSMQLEVLSEGRLFEQIENRGNLFSRSFRS